MLLSEQFEAEYKLTKDLEILTDQLQQTHLELEREKQKTDTYEHFPHQNQFLQIVPCVISVINLKYFICKIPSTVMEWDQIESPGPMTLSVSWPMPNYEKWPLIHGKLAIKLLNFFPILKRLLYSVLPATVANELRHGRPVEARKYEMVTLLFSGIVGFWYYSLPIMANLHKMNVTRHLEISSKSIDVRRVCQEPGLSRKIVM